MPLIRPRTNRVTRVRHICRLAQPTRDVLVLYTRFIGDSPDYVLNALIDVTIAKDGDFLTWRAEQALAPTPPTRAEGVTPPRPRHGASA